jgi:EAL domain-containing protein (putative c-di-GMP-specific phosphodiesterase class I)/ActR/RegA family two-component response regulator
MAGLRDGAGARAASGRLLVVEDNAELLRLTAELLESAGFEVHTAPNGRLALDRLNTTEFDVVISDISMPDLGGMALLQHVRERDVDLPVILLTGDPALPTALQALEYGAFRYLVKPVSVEVLEDAVLRAARLHSLARLKRQALQLLGDDLGDPETLDGRLAEGMRTLWLAFQPIVLAEGGGLYAYEAFVRCREASLAAPYAFFSAAERLGRLADLGRAVRAAAAARMSALADDVLMFINVHPRELDDEQLYAPDSPLAPFAGRVVLEITERAPLDGVRDLTERMQRLRDLGFRLAVDDLGAGYAGLATFSQLQPEIVKLDMSLVRRVDANPTKLAVIRSMRQLCGDLGILVVAEGVELPAERDVLVAAGCPLLQGYLFGRPQAGFLGDNG